jgi:CrcB protein
VGLGGVGGACLRYFFFVVLQNKNTGLPTLAVNVLGCALLGLTLGFLDLKYRLPEELKLFLVTGFIGSFTTFATFIADASLLLEKNEILSSLGYTALSVLLGGLSYWAVIWLLRFCRLGS